MSEVDSDLLEFCFNLLLLLSIRFKISDRTISYNRFSRNFVRLSSLAYLHELLTCKNKKKKKNYYFTFTSRG